MELVLVYTNDRTDVKKYFINVIKHIVNCFKVIVTFVLNRCKYL